MSDSNAELRKVVRQEFSRYGNLAGLFLLTLACAGDCLVWLFVVPKFQMIFADALPGKPLPGMTLLFFRYNFLFALTALAWPIVGIGLYRLQNRYASYWIIGGIVLFFLLLGVTMFALFTPMVGLDGGMSDAGK